MIIDGVHAESRLDELLGLLVLINLGRTRADGEATLKVEGRCGEVLQEVVEGLDPRTLTPTLSLTPSAPTRGEGATALPRPSAVGERGAGAGAPLPGWARRV